MALSNRIKQMSADPQLQEKLLKARRSKGAGVGSASGANAERAIISEHTQNVAGRELRSKETGARIAAAERNLSLNTRKLDTQKSQFDTSRDFASKKLDFVDADLATSKKDTKTLNAIAIAGLGVNTGQAIADYQAGLEWDKNAAKQLELYTKNGDLEGAFNLKQLMLMRKAMTPGGYVK